GIKNVRLIADNLAQVGPDYGKFDFIIAHGLYSWVPDEVQDAILRICRENLAPQGVAYVSYNCLPGWRFRGALRDMMIMHTRNFPDINQKVQQSRALLKFLAEACDENTAYGKHLRGELELFSRCDDSYIAHEFLEDENRPLYFVDFLAQAAKHDLQYLGEAELSTMLTENLPPQAAETLRKLKLPQVDVEQYMDFIRNRMFRSTLLVHKEVPINRNIDPSLVEQFYISPLVELSNPDAPPSEDAIYKYPAGGEIRLTEPFGKSLLRSIWEQGYHAVSCREVIEKALDAAPLPEGITRETLRSQLQTALVSWAFRKIVDFYTAPLNYRKASSQLPEALPFTRWQAHTSQRLTNQRGEMIPSDPFANKLVQLCDGTHDSTALQLKLSSAAEAREFTINENDKPIEDPIRLRETVSILLQNTLPRLYRLGFMCLSPS
ncbi:MAG: class I SAM-dependent methyltransferase, partial [Chthoniobacterales bacterium]|nr:class I SAM-dependent methyltransferase [Chthoniobacterales bacterium]